MTFSVDNDLNQILELINNNIIESSNFINDSTLKNKYFVSDDVNPDKLGITKTDYDNNQTSQILLMIQNSNDDVDNGFQYNKLKSKSNENLSGLFVDNDGLIYAKTNNNKKLYDLRHFKNDTNYYHLTKIVTNTDILQITEEPVKSDYSDNYLRFQLFKELEKKSDNEISDTNITTILDKYIVDSSTYRDTKINHLITLITDIKDNYRAKLKFFIECAKHYYHIRLLLKSNDFIKNIYSSDSAKITFTENITEDKQTTLFTSLQAKINNLKLNTESISSEYEQTIQSNIYDKLDNIKNINKNLMNRQDTTKSKNDEFKKLLDNTFYNNIFLYITILILIICCFTVIGIEVNNKNNNSLIVILAFLIFYYIIYNSFNKIENFNVDETDVKNTIKEYHKKVMSYLYKRANALPNINDAILREENKYSSYDLMSKSHLNKLNISLNDEFLQYLKNKELINFLILVTIIGILCYQIYKKLDDITIPTIVGVILLLIITTVYFYNISLNTHSKYESKYWNHRYPMKK